MVIGGLGIETGPYLLPGQRGLVWDYAKGRFVEATEEEIAERERLYEQLPMVAPPGTPDTITLQEYYEQVVGDIYDYFPTVSGKGAISLELAYSNIIPNFLDYLEEYPQEAEAQLREAGQTEATERILGFLGMSPDKIAAFYREFEAPEFAEPELDEETRLLQLVFPTAELDALREWANEEPEAFESAIRAKGDKPETRALIQYLTPEATVTEADFAQFFYPEEKMAIAENGAYIPSNGAIFLDYFTQCAFPRSGSWRTTN